MAPLPGDGLATVIRTRLPRCQLSHAARIPVPLNVADSNRDSNSSNHRPPAATGHSA
jgi:hypothetical protein